MSAFLVVLQCANVALALHNLLAGDDYLFVVNLASIAIVGLAATFRAGGPRV